MPDKHYDITVRGRVQGVFFRVAAKEKALTMRISGITHNQDDGSVLIEAEGDAATLDKFVEWCRVGPEMATVKSVDWREGEWRGLQGFLIR